MLVTSNGVIYGRALISITIAEAQKNLLQLIEQVNADGGPIVITSPKGSAILIALSQYESLTQTAQLRGPQ